MSNPGLPVPPGFTITSGAYRAYMEDGELPNGLMESVAEYLKNPEEATSKRLGDPEDPLLISDRSGERQERVTGYLLPGNFGHSVAEMEEDALALVGEAARRLLPEAARFFCPLSEGIFYRKALQAGCRAIKVMNYMTLGPYEHPDEVWMP